MHLSVGGAKKRQRVVAFVHFARYANPLPYLGCLINSKTSRQALREQQTPVSVVTELSTSEALKIVAPPPLLNFKQSPGGCKSLIKFSKLSPRPTTIPQGALSGQWVSMEHGWEWEGNMAQWTGIALASHETCVISNPQACARAPPERATDTHNARRKIPFCTTGINWMFIMRSMRIYQCPRITARNEGLARVCWRSG